MTNQRFDFYDQDGNFRVEIKTQKNVWLIMGLALYFLVKLPHRLWRFQEIVEREILNTTHLETGAVAFVIFMGSLLILVIVLAIIWLLWSLFGREVIKIEGDRLTVKLELFGFGPQKNYWLHKTSNIGVKMQQNPMASILKGGNVEFLYDGKPKRFGWTLAQEDAQTIIHELSPHLREKVIQLIK